MRVRPAGPSDVEALATVHVHAWQEAYRGQIPQEYLDGIDLAERIRLWDTVIRNDRPEVGALVLDHGDDGVVGFISVAPSRDEDTDPRVVGEITAIYLLPAYWGQGGGAMLLRAGLRRLVDAGYHEVLLWVLEMNERARGFYASHGWRPDGTTKLDVSWGFPLAELRYRRCWPGDDRSRAISL